MAFPHLEEDIFEEARLQKWMDQVVIPAMTQSLRSSTLQYLQHSRVERIRLHSPAGRVEGLVDVADIRLAFCSYY